MAIFIHEIKQSRKSFLIWSLSIGGLILLCMALFPQMKGQMDEIDAMFSNMGSFTAAFGMDQISYSTSIGFYGIECGVILSLGGAFYAAQLGIGVLAKEEGHHTAEFLYTHPKARRKLLLGKGLAVISCLIAMNAVVFGFAVGSFWMIGEAIAWREFLLYHLAQILLHIEIAAICFGISAFLRRSSLGIGFGIASVMYFLNIYANISTSADYMKYITPFQFADAAAIIKAVKLDMAAVCVGAVYTVAFVFMALVKYTKKDIVA